MPSINNQVTTLFHVKAIAPAGLKLHELHPFQVALFDEKTQRTVASVESCKNKPFSFVWRSPSKGISGPFPDLFDVKKPLKSLQVTDVHDIHYGKAQTERKPFIGYLGYDGISICKTLTFGCNKTYEIVIHVKGKPVRDVFQGRDRTETISFHTGCCENCDEVENARVTLGKMVNEIQTNSNYVNKFFDVEQVYNICPAPDPFTRVAFTDYCISICDTGDDGALAAVQNQYQGLKVTRSARVDATSTYKVECASALPAAYVQTGTVLPNCVTCPSGFTASTARKKYIVTIDNAGTGTTPANWLTEVQAAGAFSVAVAATRLSRNGSVSVYEVLVPTNFVEPATPIADTTFSFVADVGVTCTQTTPITTVWTACGTSYKIIRTLCMTLKNSDCGNPAADLAAITAYYATTPDIVSASLVQDTAGDCLSLYEIQQYSNCVVDGCDTVGADKATFKDLPPYLGQSWSMCKCEGWTLDVDGCPVPPTPTLENAQIGLKFTGKIFATDRVACASDVWDDFENEGVTIEVALTDKTLEMCNQPVVDWYVAQWPTLENGRGIWYALEEAQSREYNGYRYHSPREVDGSLLANRLGFNYTIDHEKFYDHLSIYHEYHRTTGSVNNSSTTREMVMLVVETTKTDLIAQLKTMLNGISSAQGLCDFI